ncbi:15-hydroxyprostaglandin dehydrogenase [NAD(+)] [Camponotus floridanus]|uniref:15-hydroxyprostaglandin dehydrogenase [NAD(+)] n=1 Tax=Camponotus floridanus TaxID=104421 RepID=UPI000DC698CF|nr:15-hydroxyprostaglandin dehydrogenase [NAD(+)] [Camponotus floridanus]
MDNVRNKSVMITGGARGLGYKFAEVLLLNGAKNVAIIDLPTSNGENAVLALQKESGTGRVIFVSCDVANAEDLKRAFEKVVDTFGTLDILINNAGIFNDKHKWEETIDINLKAYIRGSYLALEHMGKYKGGKGGVIVNVSSVCGLSVFFPGPVYTASKYGVLGFSQALAGLYDYTGVRVLIICPGMTDTNLADNATENVIHFLDAEYTKQSIEPFKPIQSVDNVAAALLELIQKGKNGAAWVSEHDQPPYAVDFPHYSTRSLPV